MFLKNIKVNFNDATFEVKYNFLEIDRPHIINIK